MKVIWTKSAELDLNETIDYILLKEEYNNAKNIYNKIKNKMILLSDNSEQGRVVPELQMLRIKKYREIIISPWRIIYKIELNTVYVLLIIDGRRNLDEILLDKLLRIDKKS